MKKDNYNSWCVAGFISAFFSPILGIVFSLIGLCDATNKKEKGKYFALAGIIISCLVALVIMIVIALGFQYSTTHTLWQYLSTQW